MALQPQKCHTIKNVRLPKKKTTEFILIYFCENMLLTKINIFKKKVESIVLNPEEKKNRTELKFLYFFSFLDIPSRYI